MTQTVHDGRTTRIAPLMLPGAYKTYGMVFPLSTHWQPATCEQAACQHYRSGWVTTVDLSDDLGRKRAHFIEHDGTRRHSKQQVSDVLVKYVFGPGQRCFAWESHRVRMERPPRFLVAGGDWRGNPLGTPLRVFDRADQWVDDFTEHQDRLQTAISRG